MAISLTVGSTVHAADIAIAPALGPTILFDQDFNHAKTKSNLGFSIGFDAYYRLPCRGCRNFSLFMSSALSSSGSFKFDSVKRKATGHVGVFKESLQIFNWNTGVDWSPKPVGKLKFHLFAAPGLYYTRVKEVSYKDGNNRDLPLPKTSSNGLNFGLMIGGGTEFMLSSRTSIGIAPRFHMNFNNFPARSSIQIPLNFKFYF